MKNKLVKLAMIRTNEDHKCPFGLSIPYGCKNAGDLINSMENPDSLGEDIIDEDKEQIYNANNILLEKENPNKQCQYANKIFPDSVECSYGENQDENIKVDTTLNGIPLANRLDPASSIDGLNSVGPPYLFQNDVMQNSYYGQYSILGNNKSINIEKLADIYYKLAIKR